MRPRLSVSRSAVELIKVFEGFRAKAAKLDDGRWTIGYGHTLTAREGAEVSEADAEALLLYDLIQASHAVNEHVFAPLNQNQFDALVSFVFNIGAPAFRTSPTLRRLNEGRPLEAALAMELWRKSDLEGQRIVIDALVRRRAAEKSLFLKPMEGWLPAPTPLLPPKIDYDAVGLIPLNSPVAARAAQEGDRLFAERVPEPEHFPAEEAPSASEAAAQAVIERLESILAEPAPPPPGPDAAAPTAAGAPTAAAATRPGPASARPDAPEPAPAARNPRADLPPITMLNAKGRRGWTNTFVLSFLGAVGVGLLLLAAVWGFQPANEPVFGFPPRTAGLAVGLLGIAAFSLAAYFLLERLGAPRERRLR